MRAAGVAVVVMAAVLAIGAGAALAHRDHLPARRVLPDGRIGSVGAPVDAAAAARQEELRAARQRVAERYGPLIRHDVPERPILSFREGLPPNPTWRDLLKAAPPPGVRDTVRIAAFRFEFENDSAGDATTGEGRFDYSQPGEDDFIDPPPHNAAYFEAHFEALRRYWWAASDGRVHVEVTLFPEGDSAAYRLDDTADYLPEGDPADWTFDSRGCGISRLVRDWIAYIDTAETSFLFSDYDSYLFIHAGPDLQGDVNFDSPGDIPSFNITYQFPDTLCDIDSIFVSDAAGDSTLLDNAWVIPETISQDFFIGALNGTMTHEFGHQLGLPDLYNTAFFFPAIGVWDLMDSGDSQSLDLGLDTQVSGLIPGGISAWTRFYLGFEKPLVVRGFAQIDSLIPSTLPNFGGDETRPRALLIPITPREYYMIENRQVEIDGVYFVTPEGDSLNSVADADSATGVVLGPARVDTIGGEEVEVASNEYDFALPGYGALIWHVDERALNEETIEFNAVNVSFLRRGLRLEEADGIPDIGNFNSFQFRGGPFDPFYEGSNDRMTPDSDPNSRSNDDLETGISVTDISRPGFLMSMTISNAPRLPGFPVVLGDSLDEKRALLVGPTVGEADEEGVHLAAVIGEDIFKVLADTLEMEDEPDTAVVDTIPPTGRVYGVPLPIGAGKPWSVAIPEPLSIPCAVADVDNQPGEEVIAVGDSGGVYVLHADGTPWEPAGGPPMPADSAGRIADLEGNFLFVPTIGPQLFLPNIDQLIAIVADTVMYGITGLAGPGAPLVESYSPVTGSIISNPVIIPGFFGRAFAVTSAGYLVGSPSFFSPLDEGEIPQQPLEVGIYPELASELAFLLWGDLDREAEGNEWFAVTREGRATAGYVRDNVDGAAKASTSPAIPEGPRLPGWPVDLGAEVFTYPSLADLDDDGQLEILIPTEDARVHVLAWNGARRIGWPITLPPRIDGAAIAGETPLVADVDGGGVEVVIGIRDGRLMAYDTAGKALPSWPYGAGEPFQYTPVLAPVAPEPGMEPVLSILSAPYDGFVYGLRLDDGDPGSIQWAGIGRDGKHSAGLVPAEEPPASGGTLLAASQSYAYPNPAHGNSTIIRYRLGRGGRVGMKIYDLSGELVEEIPEEIRPAGDNEYHWDLSRLGSGVYLCKLEVDDGGEAASTLLKIAVMR